MLIQIFFFSLHLVSVPTEHGADFQKGYQLMCSGDFAHGVEELKKVQSPEVSRINAQMMIQNFEAKKRGIPDLPAMLEVEINSLSDGERIIKADKFMGQGAMAQYKQLLSFKAKDPKVEFLRQLFAFDVYNKNLIDQNLNQIEKWREEWREEASVWVDIFELKLLLWKNSMSASRSASFEEVERTLWQDKQNGLLDKILKDRSLDFSQLTFLLHVFDNFGNVSRAKGMEIGDRLVNECPVIESSWLSRAWEYFLEFKLQRHHKTDKIQSTFEAARKVIEERISKAPTDIANYRAMQADLYMHEKNHERAKQELELIAKSSVPPYGHFKELYENLQKGIAERQRRMWIYLSTAIVAVLVTVLILIRRKRKK